jgi:alpha-galactosidase
MRSHLRLPAAALLALFAAARLSAQVLAAAPPMGWNSWDAYGLTIDEPQFRANAGVLHQLRRYGWRYAVIDEGWYLANPEARPAAFRYSWDTHGRLIPDPARFPSAARGVGFRPLADWVHTQGLKFGIHILRGIPRGVVRANLPIADSAFHAAEAADPSDTCPWNADNYGVRDTAAGQAYYDSMLRLYASWGVDFLKVDCIADHPYKPAEIRMIAAAIRKSGRPIVLSLSPGPTRLAHAGEVAKYAQMWRIADDIWDGWSFPGLSWPNGLLSAFDNLAKWAKYAEPGHWPDADMLPWGWLGPHPGWGPPRQSRLTAEERRTQFTLWAMARSPLILGGNLTRLDPFTRSLIANGEVIAIDQTATASAQLPADPADAARLRLWSAATPQGRYIAVFNLAERPLRTAIPWSAAGENGASHDVYDIWKRERLRKARALRVDLAPHGCGLFRVER